MSDHSHDDTLGPDDQHPADEATREAVVSSESAGDQLGRYKLLELIGEGGFGSVWAAEQREPVKRRVALKIIKLGMDTRQVIARFEAERQALAMMDHPNIAKVLDAGATDSGRPFFAMELVKGVPILDYCDREKLDTKARLDLFMKVCRAIQHAHQKGIIHRDIKPGNVLVTLHDGTPVPKVIDFGIAKATNQELTEKTVYTQHHQMIGTPAYMSPEQAEMSGLDIDTRSDIYSLGVLLYEMLTGTTPFETKSLMEAGFAEMMRILREETPHKPSTRLSSLGETGTRTAEQRRAPDVKRLGLILRGDLDWIVMKCLEKDRTRRYDTANGLAEDIERHLNDEPVSASPPSTGYKLRKFVKRNKGQVFAGGAIAALLVLGIIGTTWGMTRAIREKDRADEQATLATAAAESERTAKLEAEESAQLAIEQAERAEAAEAEATARAEELELVADFQAEQLGAIEPQVMGANLRRSLLDAVPEEDRAALEEALASINFTTVAVATLEENIFERTIAAIDTQFAEQPLVRAQLLQSAAYVMSSLGLPDLAIGSQQRALTIRRDRLGDDHQETLESIDALGILLRDRGELQAAEARFREVLEARSRIFGDENPDTLRAKHNLGSALQSQGRLDESEIIFSKALEASRRVLGDNHSQTLSSIRNLGGVFESQGRLEKAEEHYREALAGFRTLYGDEHPDTLSCVALVGLILESRGLVEDAEPFFRQAVEGRRRTLGDEHPDTLNSINDFGAMLQSQGRLDEATAYLEDALEVSRRTRGNDHPGTLVLLSNMADLLDSQGRYADSERYYREALAGFQRVLGEEHPNTLISLNNLGVFLRTQGRLEEAEGYYRQALESNRRLYGDDHPDTLISLANMGGLIEAQGRFEDAEPYYVEALRGFRDALGERHPNSLILAGNYAQILIDLGRPGEALELLGVAVSAGPDTFGDDHPMVGKFLTLQGRSLGKLERYEEATEALLKAYAIVIAALGPDHARSRVVTEILADVYTNWHEAEPEAGHDTTAAEWRAKLDASSDSDD